MRKSDLAGRLLKAARAAYEALGDVTGDLLTFQQSPRLIWKTQQAHKALGRVLADYSKKAKQTKKR